MNNPASPTPSLDDQIAQLHEFIEMARHLIYHGEPINITELDKKIAELCSDIEKMEPRHTQGALEKLQYLFEKVDILEKDLAKQHDVLTERLQLKQKGANPLFAQEIMHEDDPKSGE